MAKFRHSRSVGKDTFDVVFLLPPRLEFVTLASSLFSQLAKKGISMIPIITSSAVSNWEEIESKFTSSRIPFKKLTDFRDKTSTQILILFKPRLTITDNDLMNVDKTFVFSGKHLNIPTMVIRETKSVLKTQVSYSWLLSEILSKLNQMPRLVKLYMFYIRSIAAVQPTLLLNTPRTSRILLRGFEDGVVGKYADYILANTQEDAEALKKHCPHAKFIRAVGNPRFDETINQRINDSLQAGKEIKGMFKIPLNKKIVLFLSSAQVEHGILTKEQKNQADQQILSAIERLKEKLDFHLIIKLHPMEKNLFPLVWKPEYDKYIHITTYELSRLIMASDIVISWFSTAMINVVVARKPLIVINFHHEREVGKPLPSTLAIADSKAAIEVTDANELHKSLVSMFNDKEFREKIKQSQDAFHDTYLKTIDGNSIIRIAAAIQEIL